MALTRLPSFTLLTTDDFTFGNVTVSGNITANYLIGNGSQLTGLPASYTDTNANAAIDARVTKSFIDNLNVDADTLDGLHSTAFATAAQGTKADSAVQPGANISVLTNDSGYLVAANLSTYATQSYVGNAVANLVNSAPAALDTLNELATALGNDASFSTTITNSLANKLSTSAFTSTADTWLGTKTTSNLSEGTNLFYTDVRANTAIDNRVTKSFIDNLSVVANVANTAYSVTGSNVSGQVANAIVAGTVYTNAQPNITSVGTLTSLSVSGNISSANYVTANFFQGNGSALSSITGANVTGQVSYAAVANSVAVANVVGIGNIATINKDGNASNVLYGNGVFAAAPTGTGGSTYGDSNVASYLPTFTGNLSPGNLSIPVTNLYITGGTANYLLQTDGTGNLSWVSAPTGGGGGGATFVSVVDTFTGDGTTSAFTLSTTPAGAEYTIVTIGGVSQPRTSYSCVGTTLTFSSAPPANAVIEVTSMGGAAIALGTASTVTSGYQPNIISVGTLVSLDVSGNITSNNIVGNLTGVATSAQTVLTNAQPNITSVGTLANLTVTGNITTSGKFIGDGSGISNIVTAQQVSSSSQPNITSVGTLTELNIAGAFSSSSFSEPVSVKSNAVGTVTHNFTDSSTFVHLTPTANFTVNVTNVPTTDNRIVVVALIIYQGATAFIPSGFQLDGFSFTPKWVSGVAPAGTANKVDVFSYSILRYNGTWDIYGQVSTYGVV